MWTFDLCLSNDYLTKNQHKRVMFDYFAKQRFLYAFKLYYIFPDVYRLFCAFSGSPDF